MTVTDLQPTTACSDPKPRASADSLELRQLVRERLELSGDPDPGTIVAPLLDELPPHLVRLAAQKGLWAIAGEVTRRRSHTPKGEAPTSARWNGAARVVAENPDVFAERVFTGEEWKLLGDCARPDLLSAAAHVRGKAQGLLASGDRYERLGRRLKRDQLVGALDPSKVAEVFYA